MSFDPESRQRGNEIAEFNKGTGDTYMVVATLVATMAFTAAFTIPGGYDDNPGPNQGLAVLARRTAFVAFSITNAIALVSSITAVFLCASANSYYPTIKLANTDQVRQDAMNMTATRYVIAIILAMLALATMTLAFVTGSYVVLSHSPALSIFIIVIGCFPCLTCIIEIKKRISFDKKITGYI